MAGDQGKGRPDPNDPFADDGQDGEGANDEPQAGAVATEGGDESPKDDDPKALRETLRNQRRANRQLADRLKELERQAGQAGTAEERATAAEKDRDRFLQELQEERALRQIMAAATRAGAPDPEDVADLMLRRNLIEFDSEGKPQEVAQAVADFKTEKPHLFGTTTASPRRVPDADAGRGNGGRGSSEQQSDWNSAFRKVAGSTRQR